MAAGSQKCCLGDNLPLIAIDEKGRWKDLILQRLTPKDRRRIVSFSIGASFVQDRVLTTKALSKVMGRLKIIAVIRPKIVKQSKSLRKECRNKAKMKI